MKAADVMTVGAATVRPDTPVSEAAQLMVQYRISGLPVVDETGKLVGIVTERDFLRRAEMGTQRRRPRWSALLFGPGALADDYVRAHARKIEDAMTRTVETVDAETPLVEVVDLMEKRDFKRVPVLRDGKLIGIISRADLLRTLARTAEAAPPYAVDDRVIRDRIVEEIDKQDWTPNNAINVSVRNGEVTLTGTVLDETVRVGIGVVAEGVPGVQKVRNQIQLVVMDAPWV